MELSWCSISRLSRMKRTHLRVRSSSCGAFKEPKAMLASSAATLVEILRGLEQASTGAAWTKPIAKAVEVSYRGLTPGELQRTADTENGAVPSIGTAPSSTLK